MVRSARRFTMMAALLATPLFLFGCGGESGPASSSGQPGGGQPAGAPASHPPVSSSRASSQSLTPVATRSSAGSADQSTPSAADLAEGRRWVGTYTIQLESLDYCATHGASLSPAGLVTHTESFDFTTEAAKDDGQGGRESNPFNFSAGTDPSVGGSTNLALSSALVLNVDQQGTRRVTEQYWNFQYADGHLTGQLVDDGAALGAAFNALYDNNLIVPCEPQLGSISKYYPIAKGATISADITSSHVSLTIEGQSRDQARRFRIDATATAV